ncbi:MAG TPA: hypothetical protein VF636_07680, partial [Sphingomonas sp.]
MRLALDRRLEGGEGTGVAAYARALDAAVRSAGIEPWGLEDRSVGRFGAPAAGAERALRWSAARWPGVRRLVEHSERRQLWR